MNITIQVTIEIVSNVKHTQNDELHSYLVWRFREKSHRCFLDCFFPLRELSCDCFTVLLAGAGSTGCSASSSSCTHTNTKKVMLKFKLFETIMCVCVCVCVCVCACIHWSTIYISTWYHFTSNFCWNNEWQSKKALTLIVHRKLLEPQNFGL